MIKMKIRMTLAVTLCLLAGFLSFSCKNETKGSEPDRLGPLRTIQMTIGGIPVEIEAALTTREQMQGLMYRDSMPENHGMIFCL